MRFTWHTLIILALLSITPKGHTQTIQTQLTIAQKLGWSKEYDKALTIYDKVLNQDPKNIEALMGKGRIYSWQKNYPLANSLYNKILKYYPNNLSAKIEQIRIQSWNKEFDTALTRCQKLLEQNPKNIGLLELYATILYWSGDIDESILNYKLVLEVKPDHFKIRDQLVKVLKWNERYKELIGWQVQLLKEKPDDGELHFQVAQTYKGLKNTKQAIHHLERAKSILPERADIRAQLGFLYASSLQHQAAMKELKKSLALGESDIESYVSLGRIYSWNNKIEEGITILQDAIVKSPNNVGAYMALANAYLYAGEWKQSQNSFNRVLELSPENGEAILGLKRIKRFKAPRVTLQFRHQEIVDNPVNSVFNSDTFTNQKSSLFVAKKISGRESLDVQYHHSILENQEGTVVEKDYEVLQQIFSTKYRRDYGNNSQVGIQASLNQASNNQDSTLYPLAEKHTFYSGFAYVSQNIYNTTLTATYARDFSLYFELENTRFHALEYFTISGDILFSENTSLFVSAGRTDISKTNGHYQTITIRPRLTFPLYQDIEIELQHKIIDLPKYHINTIFINYHNQLHRLIYNLQYSYGQDTLEKSYEHAFNFVGGIKVLRVWSLNFDLSYAKEGGDDSDKSYSTQISIGRSF
jgi:tetratricopeptide (TPR) repeat protein